MIMKLAGIQKLSLLDYPGKMCATVFTPGCNFCCPFCHNSPLVTQIDESQTLDLNDFFAFLNERKNILDAVTISGGEPLLQPDLESFIKDIKKSGFLVKLDTNGSLPEKLQNIIDLKIVDYIAMDIKNSREKYLDTIGLPEFELSKIDKSIEIIKNSGISYEFRTTVVRELHDISDIEKIGLWLSGSKTYALQNFVASENTIAKGLSSHEKSTLNAMKDSILRHFDSVLIRGI